MDLRGRQRRRAARGRYRPGPGAPSATRSPRLTARPPTFFLYEPSDPEDFNNAAARAEGWELVEIDHAVRSLELRRVEASDGTTTPAFASEEEAIAIVARRAAGGGLPTPKSRLPAGLLRIHPSRSFGADRDTNMRRLPASMLAGALAVAPTTLAAASLPELRADPPIELPELQLCTRSPFCTFSEEITINITCLDGRITRLRKSIDHYFNFSDAKACAFCSVFLENDGIEVREGPRGYCRLTEAGYSPDRSLAATPFVCLNEDELNATCPRRGQDEFRLDAWTSYFQFIPCDYYGPTSEFPPDRMTCR